MFENFAIQRLLLMVVPVLLGLTVHECAHGLTAWRLGDDTARREGRLTLNPLAHLDPLGTLMLFLSSLSGIGFGWAKPVPFDPRNFRNPVRDITLVALAGPLANFLTALAAVSLLQAAAAFNLLPMLPQSVLENLLNIVYLTVLVNLSLGVFNLLPCPPLDGFKVLAYFLPPSWAALAYRNSPVFFILFIALLATGVLQHILGPAVGALCDLMWPAAFR
jgi:Zn-dependent protease